LGHGLIYLRSVLFQIFFWTFSVLINLAFLPALLMPRRATVRGMELWASGTMWGLKHIGGLEYEVRGRENIPSAPAIFASKHLSLWETIAAHILLKDPAQVMKRQLLYVPVYGWYAQKVGMIVIDREGHAKTLRKLINDGKATIAAGRPIFIFPEGTRKALGAPPDYKPGVAALYATLNVPCVPVAHNSGLFWSKHGVHPRPGHMVVEFLPPIAPGLKRDAFMTELERRIEEATARLLAEGGFRAQPLAEAAPAT
jgi:1-acyl-sn-glycerol-3-phosphate acyltransferase